MLISAENIYLNLNYKSRIELLTFLGGKLYEQGYVKPTYTEALLAREKVTPTGLQTKSVAVAIPHTDAGHVNSPQVVVATLQNPISFYLMEDPSLSIDVSLVFMLAVNNPDEQIDLLMKMSSILGDGELLVNIKQSSDKNELLEYIKILND